MTLQDTATTTLGKSATPLAQANPRKSGVFALADGHGAFAARALLDDNNTSGLDHLLAALDSHASIEVRLFNPFAFRRWRPLGYLFDFARLNRRMHNKSRAGSSEPDNAKGELSRELGTSIARFQEGVAPTNPRSTGAKNSGRKLFSTALPAFALAVVATAFSAQAASTAR